MNAEIVGPPIVQDKAQIWIITPEPEKVIEHRCEAHDLRPGMIEKNLKLRNPIYEETAAYGHMGRDPKVIKKHFERPNNGIIEKKVIEVELFTWEKLDYVDKVKAAFGIK